MERETTLPTEAPKDEMVMVLENPQTKGFSMELSPAAERFGLHICMAAAALALVGTITLLSLGEHPLTTLRSMQLIP